LTEYNSRQDIIKKSNKPPPADSELSCTYRG